METHGEALRASKPPDKAQKGGCCAPSPALARGPSPERPPPARFRVRPQPGMRPGPLSHPRRQPAAMSGSQAAFGTGRSTLPSRSAEPGGLGSQQIPRTKHPWRVQGRIPLRPAGLRSAAKPGLGKRSWTGPWKAFAKGWVRRCPEGLRLPLDPHNPGRAARAALPPEPNRPFPALTTAKGVLDAPTDPRADCPSRWHDNPVRRMQAASSRF